MKRLSLLTLVFAVLFIIFFLLLVLFRTPFPPYPLMSYQDAFDLLTPLILIPIYWLLSRYSTTGEANLFEGLAFMLLCAGWVLGHGMHLSANSIDNLIEGLARRQTLDITDSSIYTLTYFYDEYLSHFVRDFSIMGLAALLSYQEWRRPAGLLTTWWLTIPAGLIHGLTCFCVFLEGNTVILALPFVALFSLLILLRGRKMLSQRPLLAFFFVACLLALVLFSGWWLYWGSFLPFSDPRVGWI